MSLKLKDKVAVVTGASKGIGAGIAKAFAREGAKVVVNYASSRTNAEKVIDDIIQNGGTATAIQADISKFDDIIYYFLYKIYRYGKRITCIRTGGRQDR